MKYIGIAVLAVSAFGTPAAAQDSSAAAQLTTLDAKREIAEMKAAMAAMQLRIDTLEAQVAMQSREGGSEPTVAKPQERPATRGARAGLNLPEPQLPNRETIADEQTGAARPHTQAPPNDPELRGFILIPGTETMIRLGGYAKVNLIYDTSPAGNADRLVTSTIPTRGGAANANIDANATRFSFEVRRPSDRGPLRFYLENDFYGGAGTTAFRLRQAHGQLNNTYAGYGYSAFVNTDAFPETLDDEGPGSEALLRLASIRQIFSLGSGMTATLSIEDPSSDIRLVPGQSATQPGPDIVVAWRIERPWGHVQAGALFRDIGYRQDSADSDAFGYGLSITGSLKVGGDFMTLGLTGGDGVSRYFNDLGGKGYDAVIAPSGEIRPLRAWGGYASYTHQWGAEWRSTLTGALLELEDAPDLAGDDFRSSQYGALNLIWAPTRSFSLGIEALYGRREQQDGEAGDVLRLQTSFKYNFVR